MHRAQPAQAAVLQHLEELGLQAAAHLADLVEEERAAVGGFEQPELAFAGVGEGAALVAEEFSSSRLAGIAAQFTLDEGHVRRGLQKWQARATSSLPVPVSPMMSTGGRVSIPSTPAMRLMRSRRSAMAGLVPTRASSWLRSRSRAS